jgi:hypothetical protein
VNVGDYGVFADIGFEQNVILAIPRRQSNADTACQNALMQAN